MASRTLYPPIVDSYMPAFVVYLENENKCRIYFNLSRYNSSNDFKSVHVSIVKHPTGTNVVKIKNSNNRYRETGIILNVNPVPVEDKIGYYYIELTDDDLTSVEEVNSKIYKGFIPGWIYKVQLRLSEIMYQSSEELSQEAWLNAHASQFSEWSTVCIIKATGPIKYKISNIVDLTDDNQNKETISDQHNYYDTTLNLSGKFIREVDKSELIYYYQYILYDNSNRIIEDSGRIYTNQYEDADSFNYTIKHLLKDGEEYYLAFKFETINKYVDGFYLYDEDQGIDERYNFICQSLGTDICPCEVITIDTINEDDDFSILNDMIIYKPHRHGTKKEENFSGSTDNNGYYTTKWSSNYYKNNIEINKTLSYVEVSGVRLPSFEIQTNTGGNALLSLGSTYGNENFTAHFEYIEKPSIKYFTSTFEEEEEGRVGVKLYSTMSGDYSGNLVIRRSSSRTKFEEWEDIFVYVCRSEIINEIPVFWDYTVESGIWYKYAVQTIDGLGFINERGKLVGGTRGVLNINNTPIIRNFNHSYLLGQNNQQLKIQFDNKIDSYKHQIYDSNIDAIGSQFTKITRNAVINYRVFPIAGLISFNMDDNELFTNRRKIYGSEVIEKLYKDYNESRNITLYDYTYEREFRQKVLDFLQDGELKIFKSPTEGNIVVRLKDVTCTPNQTTDRLIYSFTANAYEMDIFNLDNCIKYNFLTLMPPSSEFAIYKTKLGQLLIDVPVNAQSPINIIQKIIDKYDSGDKNIAGKSFKVNKIHHMKITFIDKPLRVLNNSGEYVSGNNFILDNTTITVYNPIRVYEFDNRVTFTGGNKLYILGSADNDVNTVSVEIDFLYDISEDIYQPKLPQTRQIVNGVGQFFEECNPKKSNYNIFSLIEYKHKLESQYNFYKLNVLHTIEIEANPGAVFGIHDENDPIDPSTKKKIYQEHTIGATGILNIDAETNIDGLIYLGMRNPNTGLIESKKTDVLVNYFYIGEQGTYKE